MSSWGVFLDRDGTLVPDAVHPVRPDQLHFYAGTGRGIRLLSGAGALLAVVSNQSAVARGLLSETGLDRLDRRLRELFRREGVGLAAAYYCPHHPEFGGPCTCRKPSPEMIERGIRELGIVREASFMVGDSRADLEAGRRAGVATVLVLTGHGRRSREEVLDLGLADHVAGNLSSAARWIVERRPGRGENGG